MFEDYFKKQFENDRLNKNALFEAVAEPVAIFLLLIYFLVNLFLNTGFYLNNFGILEMFFLYGPFIASLCSSGYLIVTRSRQKGRLPSVIVNIFIGIGWGYLLLIPVWYDATKLWILPDIPILDLLATNEIFSIAMLVAFVVPLIYSVWLLFAYVNVRKFSTD